MKDPESSTIYELHSSCTDKRNEYLLAGNEIEKLIEANRFPYPLDKFQHEKASFNKLTEIHVRLEAILGFHPVWTDVKPYENRSLVAYRLCLLVSTIAVMLAIFSSDFPTNIILGVFIAGFYSYLEFQRRQHIKSVSSYLYNVNRYLGGSLDTKKPSQNENSSNTEQIKKLHELLQSGALTQDEFDSEKKKIIGKAA